MSKPRPRVWLTVLLAWLVVPVPAVGFVVMVIFMPESHGDLSITVESAIVGFSATVYMSVFLLSALINATIIAVRTVRGRADYATSILVWHLLALLVVGIAWVASFGFGLEALGAVVALSLAVAILSVEVCRYASRSAASVESGRGYY